jgi:hypothetical protein
MVTNSPEADRYGNVRIHLHEGKLIEQTVKEKGSIS